MPGAKHEVQTFDCHPLGGGTENGESHISVRPDAAHSILVVTLSAACDVLLLGDAYSQAIPQTEADTDQALIENVAIRLNLCARARLM
jgi:hypothetical protein